MMLLHTLGLVRFPYVLHSRGVGVVYEFIKCTTITGVKLGLIHAWIFLAPVTIRMRSRITNWKMITCLEFHLRSYMLLSSTERIETKIFQLDQIVLCSVGLENKQFFYTYLPTYHPPNDFQDFGAPFWVINDKKMPYLIIIIILNKVEEEGKKSSAYLCILKCLMILSII